MGRSIEKGPFVDGHLQEKIVKAKASNQKTPIQDVVAPFEVITPEFVGLTFSVHNGKVFNPVFVTEKHGGPSFG